MRSLQSTALKSELERRRAGGASKAETLLKTLSPGQRSFINDPARFKLVRASRRAGKSYSDAAYLIYECLIRPSTPTLYIGLTRESAKEAVWSILITILDALDIAHEARPSALRITFPNGSFIRLFGADTPNAKDRLRGQKFKLVIIDECGFFQAVDAMIPALMPTLADLSGTLAMTSSPGIVLSGFFYEADEGTSKDVWSRHVWTMSDNPFFQQPARNPTKYANRAEEELDVICRTLYNGDRERPAFKREYLGQWVRDSTSLIYPYEDSNLLDAPTPLPKERYGIGIDIGVSSASAVVVMKYSAYSREVQIVETWSEAEVLVDDFARIVQDFITQYSPDAIVADVGGMGLAVVQELRRRYDMPIRAADKIEKAFFQRVFANDLLSGYIKCVRKLDIVNEWSKLVKDEDGDEVKGQRNHQSDAALYIYRYLYQTVLKSFVPAESVETKMLRQLEEAAIRERDEAEEDRSYL